MVCTSGTSATSATTSSEGVSRIQASLVCAWTSLLWARGMATGARCGCASALTLIRYGQPPLVNGGHPANVARPGVVPKPSEQNQSGPAGESRGPAMRSLAHGVERLQETLELRLDVAEDLGRV